MVTKKILPICSFIINLFGCCFPCWPKKTQPARENKIQSAENDNNEIISNQISDAKIAYYIKKKAFYIPCDPANMEELADCIIITCARAGSERFEGYVGQRFDQCPKEFNSLSEHFRQYLDSDYGVILNCDRFDIVSCIDNSKLLGDGIPDSVGLLVVPGTGFKTAYIVRSEDRKLFYCEYKDDQFVDIRDEATESDIRDRCSESYYEFIIPKLYTSFKILSPLFPFNKSNYSAPNSLVTAAALSPINQEDAKLYRIDGEGLSQVDMSKFKNSLSYPLFYWLPYSDAGMLRETTDGQKVLTRVLGYKDGEAVLEYVKINGNMFEPGTKEESANCCQRLLGEQ